VAETEAVIRDVVVGRLREGADPALLDEGLNGLLTLPLQGLLEMHAGRDAGLGPGGWDYAITADFANAEAYRRYDADPEHDRLRRECFDVVSAEIARVQFEVTDEQGHRHVELAGESYWVEPEQAPRLGQEHHGQEW
jgi:hypothetical protein